MKQRFEFADNCICPLCLKKYKELNPDMISCAWLGIDNDYCPLIYSVANEIGLISFDDYFEQGMLKTYHNC